MEKEDRLDRIFELRKLFHDALAEKGLTVKPQNFDIERRDCQRYIRDVSLRGVEEIFEALQHLKNTKPHRQTQIVEFNRDAFLEEYIDAFNFFLGVIIEAGFTVDEFYRKYLEKDKIIHERLKTGY